MEINHSSSLACSRSRKRASCETMQMSHIDKGTISSTEIRLKSLGDLRLSYEKKTDNIYSHWTFVRLIDFLKNHIVTLHDYGQWISKEYQSILNRINCQSTYLSFSTRTLRTKNDNIYLQSMIATMKTMTDCSLWLNIWFEWNMCLVRHEWNRFKR